MCVQRAHFIVYSMHVLFVLHAKLTTDIIGEDKYIEAVIAALQGVWHMEANSEGVHKHFLHLPKLHQIAT